MAATTNHRHFVVEPGADSADDTLVTVVIPAYNAIATIDDTLESVRGQTHRALEILVVDDGSTDGTQDAVLRHARKDERVRLITQANAGVAAARNTGISQARGAYIAPVDADDVWRADKIALQLAAFSRSDTIGLVYSWSVLIDEGDLILDAKPTPDVPGNLLVTVARRNIIGNGSAIMVRKEIAQAVGYDPSLRARGAQGCEDWKFYFDAAEHCDFAVVPAYLTGYRQMRGNMSSDVTRMLRSRDLCAEEFERRHPELKPRFHQGRNRTMKLLLYRLLRERRGRGLMSLLATMLRHDLWYALETFAGLPRAAIAPLIRRARRKAGGSVAVYDWRAAPQD